MSNKYYLMSEYKSTREKKAVGYPIHFDYDLVNCDMREWKDNCILQCKQEVIELRVKNPRISFDLANTASDNFFFSNILWEVICDYKSWDLDFKKVVFYGKDRKKISTKDYVVACFINRYDKEKKYIDRLKSLYIVPNYKRDRKAILIKPYLNYDVLNLFDILPSEFSYSSSSLIVSEKVKNDERLKNTKLTFTPIEDVAEFSMFKEKGIAEYYFMVKDLDALKKQEPISGEELLKNGYKNGKKISF